MEKPETGSLISRRRLLKSAGLLSGMVLLAACGQAPAASPTAQPQQAAPTAQATTAPAGGAQPTATQAPPQAQPITTPTPVAQAAPQPTPSTLAKIPRNRTLILMWQGGSTNGRWTDWDIWQEYTQGSSHQNGLGIFFEPLAYYSAFADKEYLWLAESYQYNDDFTQLTIKTRSGISWSDGQPFTAEDVAYTFNTLKDLGAKVVWGHEVQQVVQEAKAVDPNTVVVQFKYPAPRFFWLCTYKYDIGVPIVPKHIFSQQQDWTKFKNFDIAKGWPVTTGPWKLVFSSPEQKIIDRRDDWWAARAGLAKMPQVERIIYLPFVGETQTAEAAIKGQIDASLDLRPETIRTVLEKNPKITTHTGNKPPYGYQDWWPTSLWFNCEKAPYSNPEVRWAISYYLDRQQIIDVAYSGASEPSPLPMPQYPPLMKYFEAVKDLLQQYPTNAYDPKKGDALLEKNGFKKGSDGIWADAQGNKLKFDIFGWTVFADIGPVVAAMLKKHGIDATYSMPPDAGDRYAAGNFIAALNGHGGSIRDPYDTLHLYQSDSVAVPGSHQVNFARWKNADFDKVVDQVYQTPMENTGKLQELFHKAMEIWLPNLPDVQIDEWYHRIPMNTEYWTNWPTEKNPYVNGAFWHYTFPIILWNLQPVS
ncbi:MAG: ABC transporter substrate-binding protein [Chloroflexi bacterium]|nr:ABC transporter substrate-binding protein [Chloroflexota bacterium]